MRSSFVSAFKINNNKVVDDDGIRAESVGSVGRSDASRKKNRLTWTKSGLSYTEYSKDKEGVYPSRGSQKACLIAEEPLIKVLAKYADFANVFSLDLAFELPKHTEINHYSIKLVNANRFIRPSESFTDVLIFFDQKSDGFFWLYLNYRSPYNISGHIGFDGQNGHDSYNSLDGHNSSYTPKQTRQGLILSENLFIDWHQPHSGIAFSHPQQYAWRGEGCLEDLYSCKYLSS